MAPSSRDPSGHRSITDSDGTNTDGDGTLAPSQPSVESTTPPIAMGNDTYAVLYNDKRTAAGIESEKYVAQSTPGRSFVFPAVPEGEDLLVLWWHPDSQPTGRTAEKKFASDLSERLEEQLKVEELANYTLVADEGNWMYARAAYGSIAIEFEKGMKQDIPFKQANSTRQGGVNTQAYMQQDVRVIGYIIGPSAGGSIDEFKCWVFHEM